MSVRPYRVAAAANRDIGSHFEFIAADSFDAAVRFFDAFHEACAKLAAMPGMGTRREFEHPELADLRSWPIKGFQNFLIFYRIEGGFVRIVRVVHGAQAPG